MLARCQIPPYIFGLGYLEGLSARGNRLARLAPEVGNLWKLKKLDLEGNVLRRLPPELALCEQLEELGLNLNSWEEPPEEVAYLCNKFITLFHICLHSVINCGFCFLITHRFEIYAA